jgi:uncharacterized HAD superfamily protein
MLIQVDVDSTLYDADKLFSKLAREAGVKWLDRDNQWRAAEELMMDDGEACNLDILKKVFRKAHSKEYVLTQKPYKNAAEVLGQVSESYDDVEIAYVSDRNSQQTQALEEWLEINGFLHSPDQTVVATKDKREWMREHRPRIVIDDRVRTILLARYELDAYVLTLEHNHNVNLKGEANGVYFGKDWLELGGLLNHLIQKVETEVKV